MTSPPPLRPSPPYLWPEPRVLDGLRSYDDVPLTALALRAGGVFGIAPALTAEGIEVLRTWLEDNPDLRVGLVVAVYPTCATREADLAVLAKVTARFDRLDVRIRAWEDVRARPTCALCFVGADGDVQHLAVGSTENLGFDATPGGKLNFVFRADAALVEAFNRYFAWLWTRSLPLGEPGVLHIPDLVLPPGTEEAQRVWDEYFEAWADAGDAGEVAKIDEATGRVTVVRADGTETPLPTEELGLAALDDLADVVAGIYERGALVSIDRESRLPPLDVSIDPRLFGDAPSLERGSVKRSVTIRVSLIDRDTLKKIEKRRQAIRDVLTTLSFGIADTMRWMPEAVRPLFEAELRRIDEEGRELIGSLLRGDTRAFVEQRLPALKSDLAAILRDCNLSAEVRDDVLNGLAAKLAERLEKAARGRFLPKVAYSAVGFRLSRSDRASPWGQAFSLLADLAAFPRKALTDPYFLRGLRIPEQELLRAMDVAEDAIFRDARPGALRDRCREELALLAQIRTAAVEADEKCRLVWRIIRGDRVGELAGEIAAKAGS